MWDPQKKLHLRKGRMKFEEEELLHLDILIVNPFEKGATVSLKGPLKELKTLDNNVLPSKFLLGGNIRDPLNLNSLSDERLSEIVNAITPESSPVPTPKHRKAEYKIRVLIPPNITDPLNLNAGVDEKEYESRLRKKIRHRKRPSYTNKKEEIIPPLPPPNPLEMPSTSATEPPAKVSKNNVVASKCKELEGEEPERRRTRGPRSIIGIDIDKDLINVARKNLRKKRDAHVISEFPKSMSILYGSVGTMEKDDGDYPNNLGFLTANYVLDSDALLETMQPEFDTIMCFSTTKWIHLNFGDEGIKRTFKRIYAQLNPGGKFILESQGFTSYRKKKKLTQKIFENFNKIKLRPEGFGDFLINEVGFVSRELIAVPQHPSRGFQRPIQIFTKPSIQKSPSSNLTTSSSAKNSPSVIVTLDEENKTKKKDVSKPGSSSSSSTASSPSVSAQKSAKNRTNKLCKPSTSKSKDKLAPKSSPYYTIGGGPTPPGRTPSIGMTPQYDLGTPCYNPEELDIPPGGYYGPDGYSNCGHIPPIQRHHSPVYTGPPPGTFSGASTPGNDESGYTPHYSGYTPSYEGGSTSNNCRRNVYTYSPGNGTHSPRTGSAPGTPPTPMSHLEHQILMHHLARQIHMPPLELKITMHHHLDLRIIKSLLGMQFDHTVLQEVNNNTNKSSTNNNSVSVSSASSLPQLQQQQHHSFLPKFNKSSEISGNTTPHPGTSSSPANSEQHRYLWYGCSSSGGTTPQSGIEDPSSSPKVVYPSTFVSSQEGTDSNPSTPVSEERPESASPQIRKSQIVEGASEGNSYLNMDFQRKYYQESNPKDSVNPIANALFLWTLPFVRRGQRTNLGPDDLFRVLPSDESKGLSDRLEREWKKETIKKKTSNFYKPSLLKAMLRTFGPQSLLSLIIVLFEECVFRILQPYAVFNIISCFTNPKSSDTELYWYRSLKTGMQIRIAASALIYRKALTLSKRSLGLSSVGQMVNLLSNDVNRFDNSTVFLQYLWVAPLQFTIVLFVTIYHVGSVTILGGFILIFFIFIQTRMINIFSKLRSKTAEKKKKQIREYKL
ncbi:MEPCE [Lepeophtheirus salmonis]|uniref:RNA methyltransferase n=1 Tax=Lepeophtheirus salmonis TaxID=72036 RepID=A0A7R8GZQ9_LEPSM|nr:MEPCE [Lepeophtheirus salmonis]CAF2771423.1 MEPCE [Lepeophtheirus salmonis]